MARRTATPEKEVQRAWQAVAMLHTKADPTAYSKKICITHHSLVRITTHMTIPLSNAYAQIQTCNQLTLRVKKWGASVAETLMQRFVAKKSVLGAY